MTSDQLIYAAEDVRYLISIMKKQNKYLSKNRLTEKFKSLCLREKKLEGETDPSLTRLSRLRKKKNNLSKMEESFFYLERRGGQKT